MKQYFNSLFNQSKTTNKNCCFCCCRSLHSSKTCDYFIFSNRITIKVHADPLGCRQSSKPEKVVYPPSIDAASFAQILASLRSPEYYAPQFAPEFSCLIASHPKPLLRAESQHYPSGASQDDCGSSRLSHMHF